MLPMVSLGSGASMAEGTRESRVRIALRLEEPGLLDRVVRELCKIERGSSLDRTLAIGELILSQFFGGDAALWRDRRRNKNNSIRRLADRKDCPLCRTTLGEAVAVYVASLEMPCARTFGHIGGSHIACVLHLPPEDREILLERANLERLSVRELRQLVTSLRRSGGERRGRPQVRRAGGAGNTSADQVERGVDALKREAPHSEDLRRRLAKLGRELLEIAGESSPFSAESELEHPETANALARSA